MTTVLINLANVSKRVELPKGKKIQRVTLIDNSEYVSGLSNNGGCYTYYTDYLRTPDNGWMCFESSSCDFEESPYPEDCTLKDILSDLTFFVVNHQGDENYEIELEF